MGIKLRSYQAALDYLFARTTGAFKFGLERTEAFLHELGRPHLAYPVIHIAGTNGKGSSVATAYALLRGRGLRVARYTSPHLVDFRERILVNNDPVPEEFIVEFIEQHMGVVERLGASFFEATTALAFQYFASEQIDVALIETGLGGRLDSTNVVKPVAAGVTSIGFDHMEYLGPTLEHIALEKAGIFKLGVPAVIGEPDAAVQAVLIAGARARSADPVIVASDSLQVSDIRVNGAGTRFTLASVTDSASIETPLLGRHQANNFAFTHALLSAAGSQYAVTLQEAAAQARNIRLPGRFQRVGSWIFDVAHNTDGARTLRATLDSLDVNAPLYVVLCVLADKDWRAMMDALVGPSVHFILTNAPSAPTARTWRLEDASAYALERKFSAESVPNFDTALERGRQGGGTMLVTGSFHTVGDAMSRLQVSPLAG